MVLVLLGVMAPSVACTNKKVNNPLANVGSKQPDKVLFDRAMDAMKHNRFDVARITLQTLINTYPDSEYIARAKLAVGDSWYAEGGTTALAQAEVEYKDFITFFPNMPEAAEAQLKIANIHYQEMEKPDRDYTHAMRAQEEYRQLIMQFPDSKLVPEAKQRLLEVQEVLAEREYRVGHFYYLRESYPPAIARLQSVAETYPLYSKADEVLFLLGQSYEGEIDLFRQRTVGSEAAKGRAIDDLTNKAADAYAKILTRYPVMPRAIEAKARLEALHRPVPTATPEAIAQNKAEEASRGEPDTFQRLTSNFNKHPDTHEAAKIGEPTLTDPPLVSASTVVLETQKVMLGQTGGGSVSVETVGKNGEPAPNQPAPRSDTAADPGAQPAQDTATPANAPVTAPTPSGAGNELQPNAEPDPNELKPNVDTAPAVPPPPQVNEIQSGAPAAAASGTPAASNTKTDTAGSADSASSSSTTVPADQTASSKKKKKKGIQKIVPF
jgi:outer membrane protein assembly factor BamD